MAQTALSGRKIAGPFLFFRQLLRIFAPGSGASLRWRRAPHRCYENPYPFHVALRSVAPPASGVGGVGGCGRGGRCLLCVQPRSRSVFPPLPFPCPDGLAVSRLRPATRCPQPAAPRPGRRLPSQCPVRFRPALCGVPRSCFQAAPSLAAPLYASLTGPAAICLVATVTAFWFVGRNVWGW